MEKADRLTGRTIQAVMRQSVSSPCPKHEGLPDQGYSDGRRDAVRWSHAAQGIWEERSGGREGSFYYIRLSLDGELLRKKRVSLLVRVVVDPRRTLGMRWDTCLSQIHLMSGFRRRKQVRNEDWNQGLNFRMHRILRIESLGRELRDGKNNLSDHYSNKFKFLLILILYHFQITTDSCMIQSCLLLFWSPYISSNFKI